MPKKRDWQEDLERILKSSQDRDAGDLINALCDLNAAMGDDAADAMLDANPHFFEYTPALKRAAYQRTVRNEISQTQRLLQQDLEGLCSIEEMVNALALTNYNRSIDMFEHLDFSHCRRMVLVGSGWLPTTLFHVHDKTDVPELVGIDITPDAIETSNKLAKRLGYERVRTELVDGALYDYGQAEIVYIVNMASPKSKILSRIADTAPENVRVVAREPYSLGRLWGDMVERGLDQRFEVTGKGSGGGYFLTRDVYLQRTRPSTSTKSALPVQ